MTNAVDHLEADGLVRRVQHPTDGRTKLAEITREGTRRASAATEAMNRELFVTLPLRGQEATELFALLRKLREDAGDF